MIQDPKVGAQEYSLQLAVLTSTVKLRIGLSESDDDSLNRAVQDDTEVLAIHQKPDEFIILLPSRMLTESNSVFVTRRRESCCTGTT